ncbi:Acyl-CoA dehydrogenase family member 11 [Takifugu flavidus]|uniref:Acyl-CoA dehydrogenase family member 11 n=1 Tax=Takifugu flavidus TaxID=433684 RepID=A0A5C6NW61_9TELE|nr:Acyl-CoA dehydrogenase family member 11 [Takifugu flavidus]
MFSGRNPQVEREFRVQKALYSLGFPVPRPLLLCTDAEVIGTEFYMMEHGRIFRDLRLPGVSAAERAALYVAAVEVLARLHSLDLASLNLEGFGKGSGYCRRQVSTWTKQYDAAATGDIPAMRELSDWLTRNLPVEDNEAALVHGDFRLDNLIFHPTEARVIAVLDWELSTTGQPLADFAYFLMHHYWPLDMNIGSMSSLKGIEGIPSVRDLISIYCLCRGIPSALPQLNFYLALSIFKLAGIAQGVYARHLLGNASAPNAAQFGQCVEPLAKIALQTAKGRAVLQQAKHFMRQYVFPAQEEVAEYYSKHAQSPQRWHTPGIIEDLKVKAREAGLWNLFLPAVSGLSQLDYAYIAEETGRCLFAPEVFNCQAPDTGNMEVLHMFGSEEQKKMWLEPLLRGELRSCFCMTERRGEGGRGRGEERRGEERRGEERRGEGRGGEERRERRGEGRERRGEGRRGEERRGRGEERRGEGRGGEGRGRHRAQKHTQKYTIQRMSFKMTPCPFLRT